MAEEQQTRKSRLSQIPWGPFVASLGAVGGAHLAGYYGSGLLTHGIEQIPGVREHWMKLSPAQRRGISQGMVTATGSIIPLAVAAQQMATSAHMREAMEKRRLLEEAKKNEGTKTASVMWTYLAAMEAR